MDKVVFYNPIVNLTLKDRVYLNLREMLVSGQISPGTRLPEEDLSRQMNVSRAPIREALNMLEREGFVTIVPRKGAFVTEVNASAMRHIWEMRLLLEPYAARQSVHLIPDEEIAHIEDLLRQSRENPQDLDLYVRCDLELHEMLYKHVDNTYLKDYISNTATLSLRARYCVEYNRETSTPATRDVYTEHAQLLEVLKKRDPQAVYETLQRHLRGSLERCQQALEDKNDQAIS